MTNYIDAGAFKNMILCASAALQSNVQAINELTVSGELDFDALFAARGEDPQYEPLPRFPAVLRDLAVVCDEAVTVAALEKCIRSVGGELLKAVDFFDVYRGLPIAPGKKSVAFSLSFRGEDRSLKDGDIEPHMTAILAALEKELGAVLR